MKATKSGFLLFIGRTVVVLCLAVVVLPCRAFVHAGEEHDIASLLDRYAAVDAEIDSLLSEVEGRPLRSRGSAAPEYYERMLSTQKNATVTIGGEFRATYAAVSSKTIIPGGYDPMVSSSLVKSETGDLSLTRSVIAIDAEIGDRWRASIGFNVDGHDGPHTIHERINPNRPGVPYTGDYPFTTSRDHNNVGEVYIEYLKGGHSGFGFKVGRFDLPFGLTTKHDFFVQSYTDAPDLTGSYLMHPLAWQDSPRLPHASKFLDPAFAAMVTYEMRDIVQFQAALFKDEGDRTGDDYGYYDGKFRSNHSLRSFLLGVTLLPLEGWELSLAFRNRFDRNRGIGYWSNSPYRGDFGRGFASGMHDPRWDAANGQWSDTGTGESFGSRQNEQAFVLGLAIEIPHTQLSASLEYAHGWNQGFNRYVHSDDLNVGLAYRLTPRLTLHGQWEWLYVKDRSWMVGDSASGWTRDRRSNNLYRVFLGAEYELHDGLTLEGGWQYEYWRFQSRHGGDNLSSVRRVLTTNMAYFGTRFVF